MARREIISDEGGILGHELSFLWSIEGSDGDIQIIGVLSAVIKRSVLGEFFSLYWGHFLESFFKEITCSYLWNSRVHGARFRMESGRCVAYWSLFVTCDMLRYTRDGHIASSHLTVELWANLTGVGGERGALRHSLEFVSSFSVQDYLLIDESLLDLFGRVEGVLLAALTKDFQHDPSASIFLVFQVHLVFFTHLSHIACSWSSELLLLLLHCLLPLLVSCHIRLVDLLLRPFERNMLQQASEQEEPLWWLFRYWDRLRNTIHNTWDF